MSDRENGEKQRNKEENKGIDAREGGRKERAIERGRVCPCQDSRRPTAAEPF